MHGDTASLKSTELNGTTELLHACTYTGDIWLQNPTNRTLFPTNNNVIISVAHWLWFPYILYSVQMPVKEVVQLTLVSWTALFLYSLTLSTCQSCDASLKYSRATARKNGIQGSQTNQSLTFPYLHSSLTASSLLLPLAGCWVQFLVFFSLQQRD